MTVETLLMSGHAPAVHQHAVTTLWVHRWEHAPSMDRRTPLNVLETRAMRTGSMSTGRFSGQAQPSSLVSQGAEDLPESERMLEGRPGCCAVMGRESGGDAEFEGVRAHVALSR
eukprot:3500353-Prymnesium_polylepis.1